MSTDTVALKPLYVAVTVKPDMYQAKLLEWHCVRCHHSCEMGHQYTDGDGPTHRGRCLVEGCGCPRVPDIYYPKGAGYTLSEAVGNLVLMNRVALNIEVVC